MNRFIRTGLIVLLIPTLALAQDEDTPEPVPEAGQAVVKIDVAGINFIDIYFRTGLYKTDLPFTDGQEAAGVVSAVGSDVTDVQQPFLLSVGYAA